MLAQLVYFVVVFVVDVVVVVVVVNVVVVAMFVVTGHTSYLVWPIKVILRLMEAAVEFVWWGGCGALYSHFHVQPKYNALWAI